MEAAAATTIRNMSTTTWSTQTLWRERLASALRTTLACSIVGCSTLYGPESFRRIPEFTAFSYVTTILIVSESTLGDTLRGCCQALYAIIQVIIPSILCLWLIGPSRFNPEVGAAVVMVVSFMVALPESTPLMTKRLAFGQMVIVCVGAVVQGAETGVVMHLIHVASSTALGALASVLAMLLPYPRLAYYEIKRTSRQYAENASERLNLFVKAFTAQDKTTALDSTLEAKSLFTAGAKLLLRIRDNQKGMLWERPQIRFLKRRCMDPREKLQELEIPIRGMDLALTSCASFPVGMIDEELRDALKTMKAHIGLKLEQVKCYAAFDAITAPEIRKECIDKSLWKLKPVSSTQDVPASFFLYCMELLHDGLPLPVAPNIQGVANETRKMQTEESNDSQNQDQSGSKPKWIRRILVTLPSCDSLIFALKCSISLGLAVLLGMIYNRENAYWSGLTIAISFVRRRQATFTVSNARAQGTAMGSVYGIVFCFLFQKIVNFRVLALLPWIIFTSFLRHSRMYGESGSISAVLGALLILGRKNYGTPSGFGIARIVEATIGLTCFVIVELLFHPARAATLAKAQLAQSVQALRDGIEGILLFANQKNMPTSTGLREKHKKLRSHINELRNFIAEAEMEPNFWFLPFNGACYNKLVGSLSRMSDLLLFVAYKTEFLSQVSGRFGVAWKEIQEQIHDDLELFKEKVGYALKCFEQVTFMKSVAALEKELHKRNISHDIELGRSSTEAVHTRLGPDEEEVEDILSSFLQHANEVVNRINTNEVEDTSQMFLYLSGLGFCTSSLMRETIEIEKELKELLRWENPSRNINLYEICCKLNAMYTK